MQDISISEFYNKLRWHFSNSNGDEILSYLESMFKNVESTSDDKLYITVGNEFASYLRFIGNTEKSYEIYNKIHRKIEKIFGYKSNEYASFLLNLGDVDMVSQNYEQALKRFNQAEEILNDLPRSEYLLASLFNNRSAAYRALYKNKEARKDIEMAISLVKNRDDKKAISLINLSEIYILEGDFSKAEKIIKEALNIYKKEGMKDDIHYANALSTAGQIYYYLGDYRKSYGFFSCSYDQFKKKFGNTKVTELIKSNLEKVKKLI